MIAYNTTWLANLHIQEKIQNDANKGLITSAEYQSVAEKYPVGFYTPNVFVRVGLVILTTIIVLFSNGLFSLILLSGGINYGAWFMILGTLSYVALEVMVSSKFHYQSGVDDALLFIAALQFGGGLCALIIGSGRSDYMLLAGVATLLGTTLTLRFIDGLMSAVASTAFLIFVFYFWISVVPGGLATAPFGMMFFSGGLYCLSVSLSNKDSLVNYHTCLQVVQAVALSALFASGNYYVVQNLGAELADRKGSVPFGAIFWVWTFAVPVAYVFFGLRKKDALLLRLGLLLLVAAGFTYRQYYHLLPLDVMLTIIGALLLIVVYALSRYLKTPKHGISADEPDDKQALDKLKIESLVAAGSLSHTPQAPTNNGVKFGGGSFGGGGSSSEY